MQFLTEEKSPNKCPPVPRFREGQDLGESPHVVLKRSRPDVNDRAEADTSHAPLVLVSAQHLGQPLARFKIDLVEI